MMRFFFWMMMFMVPCFFSGCTFWEEQVVTPMEEALNNTFRPRAAPGQTTDPQFGDIMSETRILYCIQFHAMPTSEQEDVLLSVITDAATQKPVYIHKVPMVTARDITDIKYVPSPDRPGFYRLHMKLTPEGKRRWSAMTGHCLNAPVAVVIDREYHRTFYPRRMTDPDRDEWVTMDVNFPPKLSRNLRKYARSNNRQLAKSAFKTPF